MGLAAPITPSRPGWRGTPPLAKIVAVHRRVLYLVSRVNESDAPALLGGFQGLNRGGNYVWNQSAPGGNHCHGAIGRSARPIWGTAGHRPNTAAFTTVTDRRVEAAADNTGCAVSHAPCGPRARSGRGTRTGRADADLCRQHEVLNQTHSRILLASTRKRRLPISRWHRPGYKA